MRVSCIWWCECSSIIFQNATLGCFISYENVFKNKEQTCFYFLLPIHDRENIVLGSDFWNGDFSSLHVFDVS